MLTMTPQEATAQTLLNMHLVALDRQGKTLALADTTKALQLIMGLHDIAVPCDVSPPPRTVRRVLREKARCSYADLGMDCHSLDCRP